MNKTFIAAARRVRVQFMMRLVVGVCAVLGLTPALHAVDNPFPNPVGDTPYTIEFDIFAEILLEPPSTNWQGTPNAIPTMMGLAPSYDGTGRLFVNSIRGPLWSISSDGSTVTKYIDLRQFVGNNPGLVTGMQKGFQTFAFHPDFNKSGEPGYGKFYTVHSTANLATADFGPGAVPITHHEVLLEWTANNPTAATYDGGAPREVLRIAEPFNDHNTGTLSFNRNSASDDPDYGMMYMSLGDGGFGSNILGLSGTGMTPFGAILRIDPLGNNSANGEYGIPSDNPFVGADPKLDELWLYGLRNSQRFSFDSGGDQNMFFGELGQGVIEEVNVGVMGGNYGWSAREGSYEFISDGDIGNNVRNDGLYIYPVAEYDHSGFVDPAPNVPGSIAIAGGYVYRDHHFSPLYGKYVFGDLVNGRVMVIDADNLPDGGPDGILELITTDGGVPETVWTDIDQHQTGTLQRADMRFGIGEHGEIFMINKQDGRIRVFSPTWLIAGDTDGDGDVDGDDLFNVKENFGGTGLGDTDGDRDVDIDDLVRVKNNYGQFAPGLTFVPEPASAALLGLGGLTLMTRRRYA